MKSWPIFLFLLVTDSLGDLDRNELLLFTTLRNTLADGPSGICNLVICWEGRNLGVFKELSNQFKCLIHLFDERSNAVFTNSDHRQVSLVDMSCPQSPGFIRKASNAGFLRSVHTWLLLHTSQRVVKDLELDVNSAVFLANETFYSGVYSVSGFYTILGNLYKENLGNWSSGVFKSEIEPYVPIALRRSDSKGTILKATIVVTDDKTMSSWDSYANTHVDSPTKVGISLLNLLLVNRNMTVEYRLADSWGKRLSNGSFDGMIGYFARGEVDMAATQLYPTEERATFMNYFVAPKVVIMKFLFISPPLSHNSNIFVLPFNWHVWIACFVLLAVFFPTLYAVTKFSPGEVLRAGEFDVSEALLINVASFCQQGSYRFQNVGNAGKIVALSLLFSTMFLYVSYTAQITVLLQAPDTSISYLKDIARSNFRLVSQDVPYSHYYLKIATEPVRKKIAQKILKNEKLNFMSIDDGLMKMKSRLYAFLAEPTGVHSRMRALFEKEEACGVEELKDSFMPDVLYMFAFRKNYSGTEMMRIRYNRLQETGHIERITSRIYTKKMKCGKHITPYSSVGLFDIHAAFVMLASGYLISCIIFVSEVLRKRISSGRRPILPNRVKISKYE